MSPAGQHSLTVEALGVLVRCFTDDAGIVHAAREAWSDALVNDDPTDPRIRTEPLTLRLSRDGQADVSGSDVAELLHNLSPAVTQRAIAARAGELLMLHAAAVADPLTGATAVLVAPSGTGKTTASRTLGDRFAYLSDETAAITREGVVLPYRKPLSIIEGGPFKTQYAPSALRLVTTKRECRLSALLIIRREPDRRDGPRVVPLEAVDAIAALAPESSYLPSLHQPLQRLAEVIGLAGGAHQVTYREASSLRDVLSGVMGAPQ